MVVSPTVGVVDVKIESRKHVQMQKDGSFEECRFMLPANLRL
jgi:hypothetical protein